MTCLLALAVSAIAMLFVIRALLLLALEVLG